MVYLIIWADSRLQQVDQLTDELLAACMAGRLEIVQIPAPSGSVLSELVDVKLDVLLWQTIKTGG